MQTIELGVTLIGMIGLIVGLILTLRTVGVLRPLNLHGRYWILVGFIGAFLMGYVMNIMILLGWIVLPISTELLVALVFFGGAFYVILVSYISLRLWEGVVGKRLSYNEAHELFKDHTGIEPPMGTFVSSKYAVKCNICNESVSFSLAGVVSSHAESLERGVEIQSGMGSKMIVVYPRHVCSDGLREIPVKMDESFEYRSHGTARPV
ncbi:MAG: hypothetical protein ACW98Y_06545 [Candidatus Thorarchaeota archaeon]|jgi:hypothetical protein